MKADYIKAVANVKAVCVHASYHPSVQQVIENVNVA
jgi:hypothetical protein